MPWVYYRIPASKAAQLKSLTKAYSTNDAITALYALTHINARAAAGTIPANEPSILQRAASMRAQCGYHPLRYLGTCPGSPATSITPNMSLQTLAAQLRTDLDAMDMHYARSLATALALSDDATKYYYGAEHRMGRDLVVSSWAKLPLATTDFGPELAGDEQYPGFVRRPNLYPAPVTYVMPLTREGDVDLAVCTTPEDHAVLRASEEWGKWAEYIG